MKNLIHRLVLKVFFIFPSLLFSQSNDYYEEDFEPLSKQSRSHIVTGGCFSIPISDFSGRAGVGGGLNLGVDMGITRYIDFSVMGNYSYWSAKSNFGVGDYATNVTSISCMGGFKFYATSSIPVPYFGLMTGIRSSHWVLFDDPYWLFAPAVGCELGDPDKDMLIDISGALNMDDNEFAKIGINISMKIGI